MTPEKEIEIIRWMKDNYPTFKTNPTQIWQMVHMLNDYHDSEVEKLNIPAVRCSFIGRLLCLIGWHQFTCKMQDCIDEFGYVPSDGRMPKTAKCSRCGKNYA